MTRNEELAVLDAAIKKLGVDSYLGPWLIQVRSSVEQMMRSDYIPNICIREAELDCKKIVAEGKEKAAQIVAEAEEKAQKVVQAKDRVLAQLYSALRKAERDLNEI